MKVLAVLFAVVAVAVAKPGYLGAPLAAPLAYAAPAVAARVVPAADAIPAAVNGLTPLGTPIDTPSVQAAKVNNAIAHANFNALNAPIIAAPAAIAAPAVVEARIAAPLSYAAAPVAYAAHGLVAPALAARVVPAADAIPAALNGLTPFGTPIDTPAVQAARALDAAVHLNAKAISLL